MLSVGELTKDCQEKLDYAKELTARLAMPEAVTMHARKASESGIQALLASLGVASLDKAKDLVEESRKHYELAQRYDGTAGALYGNLSIACGVQALIIYFEYQDLEQKKRTG
jgi:hypothetical protein